MFKLYLISLLIINCNAEDDDDRHKCKLVTNEPEYQPNIYLCSKGYACCRVYGQPACCSEDIRLEDEITSFCLFFGIGVGILLVAWTIQWYFDDDNPSDLNFYTEYSRKNEVEDPIFGPILHEETPKYVNVLINLSVQRAD
uniref:WAP domain-containing protein n=1 Tax=Syphacia muris TaxID=451379 RepID=A0A0N5ACK5_9BILA